MKSLIYAHRGASGETPENTMAAFRLAVEQGAEGIELDVQMSADGELVVIHDETLDRTTTGHGPVHRHSAKELKRLTAANGMPAYPQEAIPFLAEVLELLQPTKLELNIELKNSIIPYTGMEERIIRLVREYAMEQRVVFSSFNHYSVSCLTRLAPDIECGILYDAMLFEPWKYAQTVGARALHPQFYSVDAHIIAGAHQSGMAVRPYTVNDEALTRRLIELGTDAIITNYPARMKALREQFFA